MTGDISIIEMKLEEIPKFHRVAAVNRRTHILLGNVKESMAEFSQEKQCAGHICRVIAPEKTIDEAMVVREDGLVFNVWLKAFESVALIKIKE